ncbi:MAG: TolC family protein [Muribaculaceae bacterium]
MKKLITIFFCAFNTYLAFANITLDECQLLAHDNYPQLKQYGLIDRITEYTVSNVAKGYLPQVGASAQASWQNAVPAFPDKMKSIYAQMGIEMTGLNKDQYKVAIDVNQSIWDGGIINNQKKIAKAEGLVSKANLDVELYALRERINNLYFGILLLDANCLQNDELQAILQSNCNKVQACIDNGIAQQSDIESIRVELLSARQLRTQLNATLQSYRKMLSIFINKDIITDTLISPNSEPINTDTDNIHPHLALFNAQRNQLSAQKLSINSSVMPRLGAFAQGFYGNPGFNMFDDMINNRWTFNFLVGVKIQWSISGLYTKKNSINKIDLSKQRIDAQEETFIFNNNLEATQQEYEISRIKNVMKDDDEIIALRKSIRTTSEAKLHNGVIDINDLIREITAENQAKLARLVHETELLKTTYDLKHILNK